MTEAQVQTQVLKFLKLKRPIGNLVCEMKIVKQPKQMNFRFRQLQDHQWKGLTEQTEKPFAYKISDSLGFAGVGRFTSKKPLDFVYMQSPSVYIGICFWATRKKKIVYFITPANLLHLKENQKYLDEISIELKSDWAIDLKRKKLFNYLTQ